MKALVFLKNAIKVLSLIMQGSGWWKGFVLALVFLAFVNGENDNRERYCLSWRLNVELHNHKNWWTIPEECFSYVKTYMEEGQYRSDLASAITNIVSYSDTICPLGDGFDAWILDVDDTALSNLQYYAARNYGGMPYDPVSFKTWSSSSRSVAIPEILELYKHLNNSGFQIIFLSGRGESQWKATQQNLLSQGYTEFSRLILREGRDKGTSAIIFKSKRRMELEIEGYRIWGNIGDQWSDLLGEAVGARTFKIPNPMYYVP